MQQKVDFGAASKPEKKGPKSVALAKIYDLAPIKKSISAYKDEINKMLAEAKTLKVTDKESNEKAVVMGTRAKSLWKKIDDETKKAITEPNEFVKAVRSFAKIFQDPLKTIEDMMKEKVRDYEYRKELERREAERKAEEEAKELQKQIDEEAKQKGVESVKVATPVMPKQSTLTRTETGSSHQRMDWTFEIEDESQVPREYLMPDEKKLRQAVAMGLREIPGVKIFEKPTTVFKTTKT